MINDLIYDIGMYDASDTEFYLSKGFRVIAVEANPKLCQEAAHKLREYVGDKRLVILNRGINDKRGIQRFRVNLSRNDRSSFLSGWCPDDNKEVIDVECVRLDEILSEFGTPYYLKVDIEHLDHVCVDALEREKRFPAFVSVETGKVRFIQRMSLLGYSRFKIISQVWNQHIRLPLQPLEGQYVDQRFTAFHSGPFGSETYGEWLSKEEALDELSKINENNFDDSRHKLMGCPKEIFSVSWFDVHTARD